MDGWRKEKLNTGFNTILDKISTDLGYIKPKGIVVGFLSVCDSAESAEVIANLSYLLAQSGLNICVADFKVFYPNLFDWLGNVTANQKGEGLIRLLNSERTEIKSVVLETDNNNIFLISSSPNDDIDDYFNFSLEDIKRVVKNMKEKFDVVLIDIPNNPPLEFCLGALMYCQRGFFVASERIEASRNIHKLLDFALKVTDNVRNFNNIVMTRMHGLTYDIGALSNIEFEGDGIKEKLKVVAKLPFIKAIQEHALEGKVYIRDDSFVNKSFSRELNKIANTIKEVISNVDH